MIHSKFTLTIFIAFLCSYSQAQVSSDFNASNELWTILNSSSGLYTPAVYKSLGGNPGGYIEDGGTSSGPAARPLVFQPTCCPIPPPLL